MFRQEEKPSCFFSYRKELIMRKDDESFRKKPGKKQKSWYQCCKFRIYKWYVGEEISNLIENDREALFRIIQKNDAAVSNVSPGIMLLESLKFAVNREETRVKNVVEIGEGKVTDYLIYD